jgi:hypothetical protein
MSNSGWQSAMERAEAQAWLLHPVVEHQKSAAIWGSSTYLTKASMWRDSNHQRENYESSYLKQNDVQEHASGPQAFLKYPSSTENMRWMSDASNVETMRDPPSVINSADSELDSNRSIENLFIQELDLSPLDATDSEMVKRDERAVDVNGSHDPSHRSREFRAKLHVSPTANDSISAKDLRLYIEWSEAGIHVWLGVDCKDDTVIAQLAKYLLRRLSDNGFNVIALVCNGKTLYKNPVEGCESASKAGMSDIESCGQMTYVTA